MCHHHFFFSLVSRSFIRSFVAFYFQLNSINQCHAARKWSGSIFSLHRIWGKKKKIVHICTRLLDVFFFSLLILLSLNFLPLKVKFNLLNHWIMLLAYLSVSYLVAINHNCKKARCDRWFHFIRSLTSDHLTFCIFITTAFFSLSLTKRILSVHLDGRIFHLHIVGKYLRITLPLSKTINFVYLTAHTAFISIANRLFCLIVTNRYKATFISHNNKHSSWRLSITYIFFLSCSQWKGFLQSHLHLAACCSFFFSPSTKYSRGNDSR